MTVYADNTYYTGTYLSGKAATITAADFPYYARRASVEIDRYTFGKIDAGNVPEVVKLCCCELAELLHNESASQSAAKGGVSSESVGGWSVSYENAEARERAHKAAVRGCVYGWLANTGLLFSGV